MERKDDFTVESAVTIPIEERMVTFHPGQALPPDGDLLALLVRYGANIVPLT